MRKGGDGCSKAYGKFKKGVAAAGKLKDEAVKKVAACEKKTTKVEAEKTHCLANAKLVKEQAVWNQDRVQAEIKKKVEAKLKKSTTKLKEAEGGKEKKLEKKVEKAEKKANKEKAKAKDAKAGAKDKVADAKAEEKSDVAA